MDPDPDSMGSLDPDPKGKMTQKIIKSYRNKFHLSNAWCSRLRSEDFSCGLDVLFGVLEIRKLQFFLYFFFLFLVFKTLDPDSLEMLDPNPDGCHGSDCDWLSKLVLRGRGTSWQKSTGRRSVNPPLSLWTTTPSAQRSTTCSKKGLSAYRSLLIIYFFGFYSFVN